MKTTIFSFVLLVSLNCCSAQSLVDLMHNTTWKATALFSDSTIREAAEIPLRKLDTAKDSLRVDVTLWHFKDGMLTVTYYNHLKKKETSIAAYSYETDSFNGILGILFNGKIIYYRAGVSSTGKLVVLKRQ